MHTEHKLEKRIKKHYKRIFDVEAMDSKLRRSIPKYKKALIIIFAYYVLVLILLVYAYSSVEFQAVFNHGNYLTWLIPIYNMWAQIALIFLAFAPISALIGGLVGGYLLAPVLLFIHKNVLGSRLLYGIQDRPQPRTFDKISRGWFPTLLAISINFIILFSARWVLDPILYLELRAGPVYRSLYMPEFLVLLMFTTGLGTLVFSPTWFLTDAGVVYSNKEKVARSDQPVEGRTVGGRFTDFLRGYAGIGVVLSYLQFLSFFLVEQQLPVDPIGQIGSLVFFFGFPIFVLIAIIPSLILLDMTKEHRIRYVRTVAGKMGITDFVEISFEKVNR